MNDQPNWVAGDGKHPIELFVMLMAFRRIEH